jgi:hypothetical protein
MLDIGEAEVKHVATGGIRVDGFIERVKHGKFLEVLRLVGRTSIKGERFFVPGGMLE